MKFGGPWGSNKVWGTIWLFTPLVQAEMGEMIYFKSPYKTIYILGKKNYVEELIENQFVD